MSSLSITIIIIALSAVIGGGVKYLSPSPEVNKVVERIAEDVIKAETGIGIEFKNDIPALKDNHKHHHHDHKK